MDERSTVVQGQHPHTHDESDGDEDPHKVTSWYRRHGYDFLVLSDHNHLTLLDYGSGRRRFRKPLMVPGEEVSVRIHGGATPVHINGIGISRIVEPFDAVDVVSTLQANVDAIVQAGGIASINNRTSSGRSTPAYKAGRGREPAGGVQRTPGHQPLRLPGQGELRRDLGRRSQRRPGDLRSGH